MYKRQTLHFELELLKLRHLLSSNNTEEVDFADKYTNLMADQEQAREAAREEAQREAAVVGGAAAAARRTGTDDAAATGADGRRAAPAGRGWVPSATRLSAEHPSGYSWRETDGEIEVDVPLRPGAKSSDVSVSISRREIRVCVDGEPLLDGEVCGALSEEDSSWSFEPSDGEGTVPTLQLDLAKRTARAADEPLWGYVLVADREAAYPPEAERAS